MFETLFYAHFEKGANAANHVIRLIEWRTTAPEILSKKIEWSMNELSESECELALQIINEIQQQEDAPLTELSEPAGDKYISQLSNIVDDRMSADLSPSELEHGAQILEMWKEQGAKVEEVKSESTLQSHTIREDMTRSDTIKARVRNRKQELNKLRELSDDELREEAARIKESLFRLNFKLALGEVDAGESIRRKKKSLARISTLMRERRSAEQPH
ncbi:MAG TPA: 50S ribosomal protein L29 [Pyrinomonadaceae bacterium]|nr:50S ribosomal protein L29 [Pyrinomonadaceae bacterium]